MKNERKYKERLQGFASYIDGFDAYPNRHGVIVFCRRIPPDDTQRKVYIQGWLYESLLAYCRISLNIDEDPVWRKVLPIRETIDEFESFFGISFVEVSHLFGSNGSQDTALWGGKVLTKKSGGSDIAMNIFDFLK